ncbi:hypothetical protein [uncultured Clostridium sp.]|uniref:hypothetical protein n=1 Tax=uncultured Clostridium sp. TaxID=59620 RepID=UPI00263BD0E5|nr:hypothetical protein [uncultured Clostridium sp.]
MSLKLIREENNKASINDYKNIEACLNLAKAYSDKAFSIGRDIFNDRSQEYKCLKAASVKTSDAINRVEISLKGKYGKRMSDEDIYKVCHQTYDINLQSIVDNNTVSLNPITITIANNGEIIM